jgi:radical SAM protein with 4Fe4S-binding SPASM domain
MAMARSPTAQVWGRPGPASKAFSHSPMLVFYELTQACDLVCQHCRACAQSRPDPSELSTDQSLELIAQLAEFSPRPALVLTGGDPLKRLDLFRLIERAVQLGLDVSITPSATPLLTFDAIRRLCDAGISRIAISIDGADAVTHDLMRGVVGSFDHSIKSLEAARRVGLSTQINTTLTPANLRQIEAMAERWTGLGISMWSVFFLVPVGRASSMRRLSAEQCEDAFARLWCQARRQPYAIKTTEAPHYRRYVIQHQVSTADREGNRAPLGYVSRGLNDGNGVMFISHKGVIHPSGFMPIECGVFPHQNVVRVYQDSPVFRSLRDATRLEGKCRICEFRNLCGGSRARAYAVTGNPMAEEPDCNYLPAALNSSN